MEIKKILQYKLTNKEIQALHDTIAIIDTICQNHPDGSCEDCVLNCFCSQLNNIDETCATFVNQVTDKLIKYQNEGK